MVNDHCMKKTGSDKIYTINPNTGDYWTVEDSNSFLDLCTSEEKSTQFLIDNTYSVKWSHYVLSSHWNTSVDPEDIIPTPVSISAVCGDGYLFGRNCYKKSVWDNENNSTYIDIRNK